jgi:drug/metabolite transporter (DMT)-like permease
VVVVGPGLALASAVVYGFVDYAGGILSRRAHFAWVTLIGQLGGLVAAVLAAVLYWADAVRLVDLLWGCLSGVGSAVTMVFLNRGISRGALSVVVPVSAVTGIALSVVCGVVFLGERPGVLAWAGIAVVLPALWCIAGGRIIRASTAVGDGLLASCGVAVQYVALGLAAAGSGLWPVAAGRVAAVLVLGAVVLRVTSRAPSPADQGWAALIGAGAAVALSLYLLAAQQHLLAITVALASLYPAIPVLLGLTVQSEEVTSLQTLGLLAAGVAVVLLSVG